MRGCSLRSPLARLYRTHQPQALGGGGFPALVEGPLWWPFLFCSHSSNSVLSLHSSRGTCQDFLTCPSSCRTADGSV